MNLSYFYYLKAIFLSFIEQQESSFTGSLENVLLEALFQGLRRIPAAQKDWSG
jgi:hypothetical protein